MQFVKATKKQSYARIALIGISGSGKTYSALRLARGLAPQGRIAVIDSERGSASKYSDRFEFDALNLESFEPLTYVAAIEAAAAAKYDVLAIDSLSHAWMGKGGALEQVDRRAGSAGSSFNAWRDVTPMQTRLVEAILRFPGHVIVTMRSKAEFVVEQNGKGKSAPRKIGTKAVQRDDLEYEFDVVLTIADDQTAMVTKTRCPALTGAALEIITEAVGETLRAWLTDGAPMEAQQLAPAPPASSLKLPSAAPAPVLPTRSFDITAVMMAIAGAKDERELKVAGAQLADAPQAVKVSMRAVYAARLSTIRQEPVEPPPAHGNCGDPGCAGCESGDASSSDLAVGQTVAPAGADAGWLGFLADIQGAHGEITDGWNEGDALVAWEAALKYSNDRAQLDANCGPWVAAARKRSGPLVAELRTRIDAEYKARRAALPGAAA